MTRDILKLFKELWICKILLWNIVLMKKRQKSYQSRDQLKIRSKDLVVTIDMIQSQVIINKIKECQFLLQTMIWNGSVSIGEDIGILKGLPLIEKSYLICF